MKNNWFKDYKNWEQEYSSKGDYHFRLKGFEKWWFNRNYEMLCYNLKPNRKVLDLGCGDGVLSNYYRSSKLIGNDISDEGLKLARDTGKYRELYKHDISEFMISPGTFDYVLSSLTLQYLSRDQFVSCVKSVHNELKPGGGFIFSYPNLNKTNNNDIIQILLENGFSIGNVNGICFRIPKVLFNLSFIPFLRIFSYLYFLFSLSAKYAPYKSYHYVIYAEKI